MIIEVAESGLFKTGQVTALEAAQKVNIYEALTWLSYKNDSQREIANQQKKQNAKNRHL